MAGQCRRGRDSVSFHKIDPQEQSETAHVTNANELALEFAQRVQEIGSGCPGVLLQSFVVDHVENRLANRA